jgi:hypothetical protein
MAATAVITLIRLSQRMAPWAMPVEPGVDAA